MLRTVIIGMVQRHFPALVHLTKQRVNQLSSTKDLNVLLEQIDLVRNEQEARIILSNPIP